MRYLVAFLRGSGLALGLVGCLAASFDFAPGGASWLELVGTGAFHLACANTIASTK